ncbi:hypothetical protein [Actinoplanes xinjiangensis]|uniref:Uncharacterized protein n=1 Tax=Actinoplanes xinjiangensis TaxID=512350 RepID=A0A316EFL6_9ACTN|nr:hypothetical protein [Actinoplanes xinjiangensis]PWK27494.1 hypothetical protein BC793_15412 [Actinoplanes xinjiangensis]GIF45284.1 hypothetical protein Axi01nite_95950 [Actinoplanes xinjiangensis]
MPPDDATKRIMGITGRIGAAALECVGTGQSMATAFGIARAGSIVGAVGVPHGSVVPLTGTPWRHCRSARPPRTPSSWWTRRR